MKLLCLETPEIRPNHSKTWSNTEYAASSSQTWRKVDLHAQRGSTSNRFDTGGARPHALGHAQFAQHCIWTKFCHPTIRFTWNVSVPQPLFVHKMDQRFDTGDVPSAVLTQTCTPIQVFFRNQLLPAASTHQLPVPPPLPHPLLLLLHRHTCVRFAWSPLHASGSNGAPFQVLVSSSVAVPHGAPDGSMAKWFSSVVVQMLHNTKEPKGW